MPSHGDGIRHGARPAQQSAGERPGRDRRGGLPGLRRARLRPGDRDRGRRGGGHLPASFFRYFESKEDAVFVAQEKMGASIAAGLAARPAGEDAWTALRSALDPVLETYQRSPGEALGRPRLIRCTPNLRVHQLERPAQWKEVIGAPLAARLGRDPTELGA